ncbi:MAG TPA: FAD:protein FMN transferase [Microthrixaceae bacterium]|nr:FAD:protein FMN transferase [Microthrixaceae bacterium]
MGVSEHHGISEHRCHVMGTDAHIVVHGGDRSTLDRAVERLVSLEARWSRFRPESELSRLNAEAATAVVVSSDTARLVATAVAAWSLTGGRFDPTTGPALIAAGYDRSFELLPVTDATGIGAAVAPIGAHPAPGCAGVVVAADVGVVHLPVGVTVDPGGIGKGLAADLVAGELLESGATGVLVSLGGDLRAAGVAPGGAWDVQLDHGTGESGRIGVVEGAVATSSVLRRRWGSPTGPAHHVIDPRTGKPTTGAAVACSVIAGEAWWAEALATAVLVAFEEHDGVRTAETLLGSDAAAIVTTADGATMTLGSHAIVDSMEVAA